jgi:hypothetical protein
MELIHLPLITKKNVKRINVFMIICLAASAIFFGCSAGSGGGGGGGGDQVETPVISPTAGDMEQDTEEITITCDTADASIHYTTNGLAPTEASDLYLGPIEAGEFGEGPLTVKAIGVKAGMDDSEVASVDYNIVDNLEPVPVITSEESGGVNGPFDITITFNETISGAPNDFVEGDLTLGNCTSSGFSNNNPVFTVTITPVTDDQDVTIDIAAAVCQDTALTPHDNVAAAQFSIFYDKDAPKGDISSTESDPTNASTIPITITFDVDVNGFTVDDLTVGNGSADNFDGGPAVYTADITPTDQGEVTVDIADDVCQSSLTGAPNMASDQFSIVYDSEGPTVSLSSSSSNPTADNPIPLTITFNEDVSGLTAGDISVGNGSAGNLLGGPQVYTAEITPDAPDVQVTIDLAAGACQDAAGNDNQDAVQILRYYSEAPSVTINQAGGQADPTNSGTINFTVVFSESVSDFATGDVTLSGTAGADTAVVSGGVTTYNVAVSGMSSNGTVIATIAAGVAHDSAGIANTASTSTDNTVSYDGTKPNVSSISSGTSSTTGAYPIPVTIVFNEQIDPLTFDTGDISVSGTAGASVQSDSLATSDNITWTVNIISSAAGSISVTVGAGVCADPAGNTNNAAPTPLARTFITSISWGGETNSTSGTTTITTPNLNITDQPNRILMVGISSEKNTAGAITVSSVVFNSGATALAAVPGVTRTYTSGDDSYITTIWYVVNPPVANASITVTFSGTPRRARVAAYWAYNVNIASPFGAINGNTAGTYPETIISTVITSTYYYSMIIDNVVGSEGSNTQTPDAGQTTIWTNGTYVSSSTAGGSRKQLASTGANTMGWTFNNQSTALMQTVVEIKIIQ